MMWLQTAGAALTCGKGVAQHPQLAYRELRNVHVGVDVAVELFNVYAPLAGKYDFAGGFLPETVCVACAVIVNGRLLCLHCRGG